MDPTKARSNLASNRPNRRLIEFQRLHFEPDGSFVWSIDEADSNLWDDLRRRWEKSNTVELRGQCDLQQLARSLLCYHRGSP